MATRVSLKDVAAAAGVSVTTASRVLSGVDRNVDDRLAERVRQAQSDLGYRVNAAARALRTQSTEAVALVVPAIENPYFAELVAAYSRRLDAVGRRLVTIDTNESVETERRQLATIDRALVDAVLVVPVSAAESGPALATVARRHRVVQIDRVADGFDGAVVRRDDAAGMRLLTEHLRAGGRRSIVLVDAQAASSASRERVAAFRTVARPRDHVLQMPAFAFSSGIDAAAHIRSEYPDADAVLCTADTIAVGVLTALQHDGYRVPHDIAIASFDGTTLVDMVAPGITSLSSVAVELVDRSLRALSEQEPTESLITSTLVRRASTARLRRPPKEY
ncbi:LacI family DNA-binding transcriptional regulator [Curtobacterium sp. 22159]|uniref:LacI family DNA-binding transcriptional regulator n=1 Tax=Curtobacterium sp. 22159 TaxID=3453882 RepID=UPI003F832B1A